MPLWHHINFAATLAFATLCHVSHFLRQAEQAFSGGSGKSEHRQRERTAGHTGIFWRCASRQGNASLKAALADPGICRRKWQLWIFDAISLLKPADMFLPNNYLNYRDWWKRNYTDISRSVLVNLYQPGDGRTLSLFYKPLTNAKFSPSHTNLMYYCRTPVHKLNDAATTALKEQNHDNMIFTYNQNGYLLQITVTSDVPVGCVCWPLENL